MKDIADTLCEIEKRIFALKLLGEVEINSQFKDFNSWIGLLCDSIDLLDQYVFDLRTAVNHHSSVLSDDPT